RQQLALQVFVPLGLEFLKRYEAYDPHEDPRAVQSLPWGELLEFEHLQGDQANAPLSHASAGSADALPRVSSKVVQYVLDELHKHAGQRV
ncbi:virulence factor SrfB, partial [Escherichia coli]|nr:virulence factor SrfB [Escherichia coli]